MYSIPENLNRKIVVKVRLLIWNLSPFVPVNSIGSLAKCANSSPAAKIEIEKVRSAIRKGQNGNDDNSVPLKNSARSVGHDRGKFEIECGKVDVDSHVARKDPIVTGNGHGLFITIRFEERDLNSFTTCVLPLKDLWRI